MNTIFYIFICCAGVALENFCFISFALLGGYLSINFFAGNDQNAHLLYVFMVFSLGYVGRVFSSFFIGVISDLCGRKYAILLTITLMSIATALIGILPGYNSIGVLATALLVICRLIQGMSHGISKPIIITYISELNIIKKELIVTIIYAASSVGAIGAFLFCFLAEKYFMPEIIASWLWRIPFLMGGILIFFVLVIYKYAIESPVFLHNNALGNRLSFGEVYNNWYMILQAILLVLPVAFLVILGLFMPTIMIKFLEYSPVESFAISLSVMGYYSIALPFFGWLLNHEQKQLNYRKASYSLLLLIGYLILFDLKIMINILFFMILMKSILAIYGAIYPVMLANLFPATHRNTTVALGYNLAFLLCAWIPSVFLTYVDSYFLLQVVMIIFILMIMFAAISFGYLSKQDS